MSQNVAAIICAAGASSRFGGKRKKAFVDVAGRAVFLRSAELFSNRDDVKQVLFASSIGAYGADIQSEAGVRSRTNDR